MTAIKIEDGKKIIIKVESKNGEPVEDKHGFVKIVSGDFKGFEKISLTILEEQFKLGA